MRKKSGLSKRQFMALGCAGTVGFWLAYSNQYAPRMMRELVADAGRKVSLPGLKPEPLDWDPNLITAAWLGHSSVLLNFYGVTILTDPVLFMRVGADLGFGTVGPKRLVAPALSVKELPPIDLVLLSHAHMDHLDTATLRNLPGKPQAVTAKSTADILSDTPLREAHELGWGQQTAMRTANGEVRVRAFEVKHWGARWRRDTYRGYNGYVIEREDAKIIFGGDTAMTDSFRQLKSRGPYDLAIMPIGAYEPWVCSHCTPEQAVRMANEAGADYILPIHHKTFKLGREVTVEPMQRLEHALEPERLALRDIGESFSLS